MTLDSSSPRNIVIVGGGIIGTTTAYYLTRHPLYNPSLHTITILEAVSIASGASGKAGGLLATWAYPKSIVPLSYKLHAELAAEHDGARKWGYRTLYCGGLSAKGRVHDDVAEKEGGKGEEVGGNKGQWQKLPKMNGSAKGMGKGERSGIPEELDWFDDESVQSYSQMGDPTTTAQVHPYQFTTSIFGLAQAAGVKVIYGSVTAIDHFDNQVRGVTYEDKDAKKINTLQASDVIVAAGPWSGKVYTDAPIDAMRAHSVVIKAEVSNFAVFSEIELPKGFGKKTGDEEGKKKGTDYGMSVSPEMYARPDGTVYACGEGDTTVPLPKTSDLVVCDEDRCQDIIDYCGSISTPLRTGEVLAKQACYLPSVSGGGGPLIGPTKVKGLFLATGHTCWGIQNSCATGKLMSEFMFEGEAKSARIDMLDPRKFC